MGKTRKKGGKAKKRRRRRREPLAGDRCFRQYQSQSRKREPGTVVFPKGLQDIFLTDEPKLRAEELRLRAIKRAKEAREKIERERGGKE